MIKVSSPGNIFLGGEHSVVYGRFGIIAAIGLKTYCEIEKRGDSLIKVDSEGYGSFELKVEELEKIQELKYEDKMDLVKDLIISYYKKFNIREGINLKITSDIPKNSGGMSSSTAVLCSVLEALNQVFPNLEKKDYYNFLIPFQRKIHGGSASGVELFSSTFGGYNKIKINPVHHEGLGKLELPILIVDTGIEAKTKETVPYVRRGWELDKKSYEDVFDKMEEIVLEEEKAIKNGDLIKLGNLMVENHRILARDLGVSHPKLNKIVDIAIRNGSYGAKLSGGGKGGIAIVLYPKEKEKQISEKLREINCQIYKTEIGVEV